MLRKALLSRLVAVIALFFAMHLQAQVPQLSNRARFSVITCSPGPDLYSLFGHSAFRLQDSIGNRYYDVVYNYGTFLFDETFYVKFARGKLDYLLQSSTYEDFIAPYEYEGRGVWEQELRLTLAEKQRLFELLQTNLKQENCTYRYDFFYDNCSTRIRDMLMRALSDNDTRSWGYRYIPFDSITQYNRIEFPYNSPEEQTYRKAIQTYLNYQPWSDLGIDIALGQPCDARVGEYGLMFLPDSLMSELALATIDGEKLCERPRQLLPVNFELSVNPWSGPTALFALFLLVHVLVHVVYRKRNAFLLTDRLLFFVLGVVGCLIVFLWFFTDHTATRMNWNILWANPVAFVLLFLSKQHVKLIYPIVLVCFILTACALVFSPMIPQSFHPSVFLLMLAQILTFGKWLFHFKRQNVSPVS